MRLAQKLLLVSPNPCWCLLLVPGPSLFQMANQLRGAANFNLYGEKMRFACSSTSSGVTVSMSTRPPASAKDSSFACLDVAIGPVWETSSCVYSLAPRQSGVNEERSM